MEIWTPKVGDDNLYLQCEDGKEHNKYPMAVLTGGCTGGHVPKNLSKIFNFFLTRPNCVPSHLKSLENVLIEQLDMD